MKKTLALFLLTVYLLTLLCACNQTTRNEENSKENVEQNSEGEYRDFYEEIFTVAYSLGTDKNGIPFWPEPTTEEAERTRAISAEVEALLNCKLRGNELSDAGNIKVWQQLFAVADYSNHWTGWPFTSSGSKINAFYKAGFLQSWNNIPTVDLSDAALWGTPHQQANATFNGELYLDVGTGSGGNMGHLIFNKILVNAFNAQNPQELYEQGLWTWDTFDDYVFTVSSFEADQYVYAVSVWANTQTSKVQFPLCAVLSNGGQVVKIAEDGSASFGLDDPEALEALDWARKLLGTGTVTFDEVWPPDTWAKSGSVFVLGDTGFGTASSGSSAHWGLDNLEDIRFIPFPYGPKAEYGKISAAYSSAATGLGMLFGIDKEDAGYVWNVHKTVSLKTQEQSEEEWIRKTFFQDDSNDYDSYNNYNMSRQLFSMDYSSQFGEDVMSQIRDSLIGIVQGTATSAEAFGQIYGIVDTAIQENIAVK